MKKIEDLIKESKAPFNLALEDNDKVQKWIKDNNFKGDVEKLGSYVELYSLTKEQVIELVNL